MPWKGIYIVAALFLVQFTPSISEASDWDDVSVGIYVGSIFPAVHSIAVSGVWRDDHRRHGHRRHGHSYYRKSHHHRPVKHHVAHRPAKHRVVHHRSGHRRPHFARSTHVVHKGGRGSDRHRGRGGERDRHRGGDREGDRQRDGDKGKGGKRH